ncbi:MAG: SUMF1/EgtB/PvdO family nonheme iron enzyme, partial [Polyangiaceae bacterium]
MSSFRLDKYLVTVSRFRQFVAAWNGGGGYLPAAGSGIHTHVNGGHGLADSSSSGTYEAGWLASDDSNVTPTDTNLACSAPYDSWTSAPGANEALPIDCVTWPEAYAFCIWDGGFLPSKTEGEYAAAGGNEQRVFPWGTAIPACPGSGCQYAISSCNSPAACTSFPGVAPVGTATLGVGRWGQLDLGGEVIEWSTDTAAVSSS